VILHGVYCFQFSGDFAFLRRRFTHEIFSMDICISYLPQLVPFVPYQVDQADLPCESGFLFKWYCFALAIIICILVITPFCAEASIKNLAPSDPALCRNQDMKVLRIMGAIWFIGWVCRGGVKPLAQGIHQQCLQWGVCVLCDTKSCNRL
jgi:hypothetical protein